MKSKLIFRNIILIIITVVMIGMLSIFITDYALLSQDKDYLKNMTLFYESNFNMANMTDFNELALTSEESEIRVTIISSQGEVLADSNYEVGSMDNHIGREEVQRLLSGEDENFTIRKSDTINAKVLYYAKKIYTQDHSDFIVFRISVLNNSLATYIGVILPAMLLVIIAVSLLSAGVAVTINKGVVKSVKMVEDSLRAVASGTYTKIVPSYKEDELNRSFNEINEIQYLITRNIRDLAEEKDKQDKILSNLDNGVVVLDKQGNISIINEFATKVFGVDSSIVGKDIFSLCLNEKILNLYDNALTSLSKVTSEVKINDRSFNVLINSNGQNTIILLNEITAIRQYTDMKNEFFANASHELKTPITSIVGFVDLYNMSESSEDKTKYIDRIGLHSTRMMKLVNDMMEVTRLDEEAVSKNVEVVDVNAVAEQVATRLEILAKSNNITIEVIGEGELIASQEDIDELFENLISNAIRYNKPNGRVDVAIAKEDKGITVHVKDTGIGIAKADIPRVFERFYRVDKGRSKRTGGTGLGLSIVKRLVTIYHGGIEVKSELGRGTEFVITLHDMAKS